MKRLRKAKCWLLWLMVLAGAIACSGEKSASGQKVAAQKTPQGKPDITCCLHREKWLMTPESVSGHMDGLSHVETQVKAGNRVTMNSGRDTTMSGAQVSAEAVKLDAGRHLTLASGQDSETFDAKQQSAGAGVGYTVGAGTVTAGVSASRDKMTSDWQSVTEQTGIFAGKGGYDITVGEHTQLEGAVIGSTADSSLNKLDTGTLGFSDIHNEAAYKVEHVGVSISTAGGIGSQLEGNMLSNVLAGINGSDSAESTTHSAVSEGTIVIRDEEKQQQDVAELSRDVENANPGLEQIFDKEKEQTRLKAAQLIAEIGSQAMDIARTEGQIAGEKAKRDPVALQAAKETLTAKGKLNPTAQQITEQAYDTAMAPYGTGSSLQRGMQAATAAIQGLAGGNVGAAVAGAAAPYLADVIHNMTTDASGKVNTEANLMAHAVLGAVTSYASGNSALAGAAGATAGEYIAQQLYPGIPRNQLSEEQKQTISALGTLAAGLAGGVAGDSTGNAVAGAQAGKNASENNNLSLPGGLAGYGQAASTLGTSMTDAGATTEEINAALSKNAKGDLPEGANITKAIVEGYKDGVLIAGAAYLGPAASVGKVVAGSTIGAIANGTYQWFDMSQSGNENKTYDYLSTGAATLTGGLAPGRGIWQNVGIAAGGAIYTDGPDIGAVGGAVVGAWAGGVFGEYAPGVVNSVIGKELPGFIYDIGGAFVLESVNDVSKEVLKKQEGGE